MNHAQLFHDAFPKLPYTFRYGSFLVTVKSVSTNGKDLWQVDDLEATYLGKPVEFPPHWFPMGWINFEYNPKDTYLLQRLICDELRSLV